MALSRTEINFRRLLNKCELMTKNKTKYDDRFPQYIESLENMLKELVSIQPRVVTEESVREYLNRVYNIKLSLGLLPGNGDNISNDILSSLGLDDKHILEKSNTLAREELLGLRQRTVHKAPAGNDLDEVIDYHENMQQKIADDMISLTKNLKEQSQLANKIIKKDTEIANRSAQLTDDNFSKLKVESSKLSEHSKGAWKCWMWAMLAIVLIIFINMVLFMKVMKKKY